MRQKKRNRICIQVQEVYLLTHLQGTSITLQHVLAAFINRRSVLEYWSLILFCLYIACFTHLISWNMRCNLRLKSFSQFVHFKEINSNVYRHSLWSIPRFHYFLEWYLISHFTFSIQTCISTFQKGILGCPLKTGVTEKLQSHMHLFCFKLNRELNLTIGRSFSSGFHTE